LSTKNAAGVAARLFDGAELVSEVLYLGLGDCTIAIRSNAADLLSGLRDYFGHVVVSERSPDMEVVAIESPPPELGIDFVDWKREPGKAGRKDAYVDLPGARVIRKIRTGMVFLQSRDARIAAGPCRTFDNQVINFINAQYMNWLQNRGWLICHASGLVRDGHCMAIAGLSGGGKSTLMLKLMNDPATSYLTNDRLFVRRRYEKTEALGIPKLPRINPGTIVHNPALHGLMTRDERDTFLAMPAEELWRIEEKYDVHVDRVYGPGRIARRARLSVFVVLNWDRGSDSALQVRRVDLSQRTDLLPAIMKSPGPFYQFADGHFFNDTTALDAEAYLAALEGVAVFEVSGVVDFEGLTNHCNQQLMGGRHDA
jgi:HprK-related kinase B